MDITEFFELSAGKWFSQRTIHNFSSGKLTAGKSTLTIGILAANDPTVVQLWGQSGDRTSMTSNAWGGLQMSWDGTAEGTSQPQSGSSLIVPMISVDSGPESPATGQFLQMRLQPANGSGVLQGHYSLGCDQVLTLVTESEDFQVEERLWYLMPNLRLRTSVIQSADGLTQASFCSEIRLLAAK
ncbi:MAG: phycobiliprotein lyase [Oscillatoriales cyanobacterium RM2_1_1]|nr:phycobiliprotein lyase [Oscillatoriales cyanobacterium SM2_3_0]NJO46714.1 phycobiliprotein lyase [Oscillatoriales cyanobacterium RM2_1_1]